MNGISGFVKSVFVPRDKSIVILDSWFGQKYADNPRYLFQYLSKHKEELGLTHVVWITRNDSIEKELNALGYECYLLDSEQSQYYHKRAYYHICNNAASSFDRFSGEILTKYSNGCKRVNLWHGTGAIKNVGFISNGYLDKTNSHPILYSIKNWLYRNFSVYRAVLSGPDLWHDCYYLSTSLSEQRKMQSFFNVPSKKIILSGYPRNSLDVELMDSEKAVLAEMDKYKYTMLYLPTFRGEDSNFNYKETAEYLYPILKQKDILWIQKAHSANEELSKYHLDNNILTLDSNFDINVITPYVTSIVTDYSSILADGLYHKKPIFLYVPDYDEYVHGERGISVDGEYILRAGIKFYKLEEFSAYLQKNPLGEFPTCYDEIRNRVWGDKDKSIAEIWKDIKECVK